MATTTAYLRNNYRTTNRDNIRVDVDTAVYFNFIFNEMNKTADYYFTGCGGELTTSSGELTSPFYPNNYIDNLDCSTSIRVSSGSRIRGDFMDLDTERGADYLTVS
jgi:CUB domain